jgi:hypothetical protein
VIDGEDVGEISSINSLSEFVGLLDHFCWALVRKLICFGWGHIVVMYWWEEKNLGQRLTKGQVPIRKSICCIDAHPS